MTIARDEIFGPVLSVIPYDSVDEAVRLANDSVFGLQANVICSRVADGLAIAKRIRSGAVSINGAMDSLRAPARRIQAERARTGVREVGPR